ncbi:sulfite exporter TauE/SafE family protein [Roseateles cellulosilyticus]|uniref:Sulfite exporter TauE/SafE family protein n=1 Tax=Pelomonas cellulosilytica TaxID=2906762 RepID=A0ABS8XRQ3_9BURK|nr:sulfite exporter TauE/SafE family protein [Pelomonas sp. P8]MCE4553587.1 sulfite exporter TauE/SafE family protein [Pelomonas sp. P8]
MSLDLALIGSAALMGLGAAPHCALMCSTPCALAARKREEQQRLLVGRLLGYSTAGAVAAASAQALAHMSQGAAVLQPLWALLQAALLVLGLSLVVRGRVPVWLANVRWRPAPGRSLATGLAWVAMPCGVLHAALLLSALANSPLGGGLAMAAFAVTSTLGLTVAPAWIARLPRRVGDASPALRLAGVGLAAASGWALVHGVWERVAQLC